MCQHLILKVLYPLALDIMGAKLSEAEERTKRYLHHPSIPVVGMRVSCGSSHRAGLPVVKWPTNPHCPEGIEGHGYSRKALDWRSD